jgi:hypothetical protein
MRAKYADTKIFRTKHKEYLQRIKLQDKIKVQCFKLAVFQLQKDA